MSGPRQKDLCFRRFKADLPCYDGDMKKSLRQWLIWLRNLSGFVALVPLVLASAARADSDIILLDLDGALGVATAEYIIGGIDQANERNADLVIIRMDTARGSQGR